MSFSPDDSRAVVTLVSSSFHHDLVEIDLASGTARSISPTFEDTRYEAVSYSGDGESLFLNTDLGSDFLNIVRLRLDDLSTEQVVSLDRDAELMTLSSDGRCLAFAANVDGESKLSFMDLSTGEIQTATQLSGGAPGVVGAADGRLSFSPDSRLLAFSFTSAVRTHDVFCWDLQTDACRALTRSSQGGLPDSAFVIPEPVTYPTFDETAPGKAREIPAWFFKPEEREGRMPVVVYVHGGPASQFRPQFFPLLQYFVRRGYAVFAPNVRGSTGYGKVYAGLDDVERRMDSVADLSYAARWLREQPEVDGDRLVLYGRSYGGFMVLSAASTYPDLWAAAVDVVGISNWVTFLENTSDYRRAHRETEYGSLEKDRAFLASISPIHQIDRIEAPLMVIHGANDPRVPVSEARQLAAALEQRGVPVDLLVFDDEGHTLSKIKNKLVAYEAIVGFLDRNL
jgi:dipeptidyl aminopeptidase/acylaminoacyl peptidase